MGGPMSLTRIAVAAGIALLTVFVILVYVGGPYGLRSVLIVVFTMVALIGAGNLLYGRRSHYAAAQARTRPAQQAHDRAADVAARARRATDAAARRGERYCPLDPAQSEPQHQPPAGA
jgi:threonine/homoserine/homoserine lactone efflux protein